MSCLTCTQCIYRIRTHSNTVALRRGETRYRAAAASDPKNSPPITRIVRKRTAERNNYIPSGMGTKHWKSSD